VGHLPVGPRQALLLLELPLTADLSSPARFAIALMVICPRAPLALRRVSSPGSSPELAACIQVSAAILADRFVFPCGWWSCSHPGQSVDGWTSTPAEVACRSRGCSCFRMAAGLFAEGLRSLPGVSAWSGVDQSSGPRPCCLLVVVLAAGDHQRSLFPFLRGTGGPVAMAFDVAISLAIGYGLAEGMLTSNEPWRW